MSKNQPYIAELAQRDKKHKPTQPEAYQPARQINPELRKKMFNMQAEEDRLRFEQQHPQ